jgi:hypothetical protein
MPLAEPEGGAGIANGMLVEAALRLDVRDDPACLFGRPFVILPENAECLSGAIFPSHLLFLPLKSQA